MHIAMIAYHACPAAFQEGLDIGGMNTYIWELSQALAEKNVFVDIFTRRHDDTRATLEALHPNINLIHLPAGPHEQISIPEMTIYLDEYVVQLVQFCQRMQRVYNIFHCHYYLSGMIASQYNQTMNTRIPIIMNFHTLGAVKNQDATHENEMANEFRLQAEQSLVLQAQHIIANCQLECTQLQAFCDAPPEKITVITPGVNTSIFKPAQPKHSLHQETTKHCLQLLFVGRTQAIKGLDQLLQALMMLEKQSPRTFFLTIIGTDLSTISKAAAGYNIMHALNIIAQTTPNELAKYYRAADLLILPSYSESFGLVALEALACGTPAVVTENCGISSLIRSYQPQWVMASNTPQCIMDTLLNLYHNPTVLQATLDVTAFGWSHVARQILLLYTFCSISFSPDMGRRCQKGG